MLDDLRTIDGSLALPDLVEPVIGSSALELLELASLLLALESEADLPDLPEDSSTGLSVTGLTVGPTVGFMDER